MSKLKKEEKELLEKIHGKKQADFRIKNLELFQKNINQPLTIAEEEEDDIKLKMPNIRKDTVLS